MAHHFLSLVIPCRRIRCAIYNSLSTLTEVYYHLVCYIWRTITMFRGLDGIWKTDQVTNLELIFLSTTVLTNIFCTTLIVCRIASTSGWRKSLQTYRRFTEILIESSVLYTVSYMIRIGLQVHSQYFADGLDERMRFGVSLGNSMTVYIIF